MRKLKIRKNYFQCISFYGKNEDIIVSIKFEGILFTVLILLPKFLFTKILKVSYNFILYLKY